MAATATSFRERSSNPLGYFIPAFHAFPGSLAAVILYVVRRMRKSSSPRPLRQASQHGG